MRVLQKVIEGDPLSQLDEQDKELIWRARCGGSQWGRTAFISSIGAGMCV